MKIEFIILLLMAGLMVATVLFLVVVMIKTAANVNAKDRNVVININAFTPAFRVTQGHPQWASRYSQEYIKKRMVQAMKDVAEVAEALNYPYAD